METSLPLPLRLIELAAQLEPGEVDRQLAVLRVGAFVRVGGERDARRVEPYHDRVRETVLTRLEDGERRELHAVVAPLLEHESAVDREIVAQHYLAAGDRDKAADLFERAAAHAEEGFAFERAASLYRRQLELRDLDPPGRSRVYRQIGAALARAGQASAAAAAYQAALEDASPTERHELQHLVATYLLRSGHVSEGLAALEQVAAEVGLQLPRSTAAAMAMFVWQRLRLRVSGYATRFREVSEIAPSALARADAAFTVAQALSLVDGIRAAPVATQALRAALATASAGASSRPWPPR